MTIPDQAIEAAKKALAPHISGFELGMLSEHQQREVEATARLVLTAALPPLRAGDREEIARVLWESQRARIKDQDGINARLIWRDPSAPAAFWHSYELDADAILSIPAVQGEVPEGWQTQVRGISERLDGCFEPTAPATPILSELVPAVRDAVIQLRELGRLPAPPVAKPKE